MKIRTQSFLVLLAMLLASFSASLRAEDTDIYVDNSGTSGTPNVLFILDNGANFDATASGAGCSSYTGTAIAPSMGPSKSAGMLQCALVDAINSLPDGSVNIGLMVSNGNGYGTDVRAGTDKAYHLPCNASGSGGCLLRPLTPMTSVNNPTHGRSNKASFIEFIKSWNAQGNNSDANNFSVKVNSAATGTAMQEAWAYFNGKTGMSGTNYGTSQLTAGCQRNFIIYIANTDKSPPSENPSPGADGSTNDFSMADSRVGASADQKGKISTTVVFDQATCGVTSMVAGNSASDWSSNWADEWARLMFQQDGGNSTQNGTQNVITYTIGITGPTCTKADYPALLSSMANFGGGDYFATSNASGLAEAILKILNDVQAVNSVFSSASLPVSVNAQGTYLNQIFLGMFRPDGDGLPRWMGNLKQYQLVRINGNLVIGDAKKLAALNPGTGFLKPTAESIWTSKATNAAPDDAATGGFFKSAPLGTPASAFDSPDGEVVEKGGVAQQLRKESLRATFDGAMASGTNPRRLYTYCPSGSSCDNDLTVAANEFSTANGGIASNAFGVDNSVRISSIVRSGTSATVTTTGNHGFVNGTVITVKNVDQTAYNVTQTLSTSTITGSTTFTITGLPDTPTTPAGGSYRFSKPGAASFAVTSITRSASAAANSATATDLATVTTSSAHNFVVGDVVQFSNNVAGYNPTATVTVKTVAADKLSFTYDLTLTPGSTGVSSTAAYPAASAKTISSASVTGNNGLSGNNRINTIQINSANHGMHAGQTVTIANANNDLNGVATIVTAATDSFTITKNGNSVSTSLSTSPPPTVSRSTTAQGVTLTRSNNAASATITATGAPANAFANGDILTIAPGVAGFANSNAQISCTSPCTTFTYTIQLPATPATVPPGTMVSVGGASVVATLVTRNAAGLVTVAAPANTFVTGDSITVAAVNGPYANESEYLGSYPITCTVTAGCPSFTYQISVTPATPATGGNMQVFSANSPPDRDTVIKWARGLNSQGDEPGPGNGVTVRASIHGDVLHSRPLVVNYGDSRGIVAFYGANDGVFRAVNGNQTAPIGSVPAGGELWGLVLPEHYGYLNRLRTNSPEVKFPSTALPSAQPKNYFIDGPTGAYQRLAADGTIQTSYIYLTMRRGGRFIYGMDVSQPQSPRRLWTISNSTPGFEELGQTWSRPRLTLLQGRTNPVLIFGGGYDTAHDTEPPTASTMGRAIYIVDAVDGSLIWSASATCGATTTASTCRQETGMTHPIPSDVAFVDRDNDGKVDKLYVGDLGGNVWRFDVATPLSTNWSVTKVASLGCHDGSVPNPVCPIVSGESVARAGRKFFFPPSVLSIKGPGATGSYEAISIASGDREHPLKNTAAGSAYNTIDRFFMLKDEGTVVKSQVPAVVTPSTVDLNLTDLFNATSTLWNGTRSGFYITLATGEKVVNAPLAVNGTVFFATNKPKDPEGTCDANLGDARAYGVSPFDGAAVSNPLVGGGLPPSAVAGIVQLVTTNADGSTTTTNEKFCIGCGISGEQLGGTNTSPCTSALENCNVGKIIPKKLKRTYWYKK
jgi:type IV pilus assembly protein PilY1